VRVFDPIFKSIKHTTGKEKKLSSTVTIVLVDGTDACQNASVNSTLTTKPIASTILNQTRVKATVAAMLLHNNSLKYVQDFFLMYILNYYYSFK
jgi:hypothetical protein